MLMVVIGFAFLVAPIPFFKNTYAQFLPAILFFAIPLLGLKIVAPDHWTAIFRKVGVKDVFWMFAFGLLNLVVTFGMGLLIKSIFGAEANPAIAGLAERSTADRVLFFLKTLPQLFGEEVMTILPFLALMFFFSSKVGCSRRKSILGAWLVSALIFGLAHLHTYDWNFVQCILIIGTARLVLSLAYMKTKNIWVSTGAHVINDWLIFGLSILGSELTAVP